MSALANTSKTLFFSFSQVPTLSLSPSPNSSRLILPHLWRPPHISNIPKYHSLVRRSLIGRSLVSGSGNNSSGAVCFSLNFVKNRMIVLHLILFLSPSISSTNLGFQGIQTFGHVVQLSEHFGADLAEFGIELDKEVVDDSN